MITSALTGPGGCQTKAHAMSIAKLEDAIDAEAERLNLPDDIPAYLASRPSVLRAAQGYVHCKRQAGYTVTGVGDGNALPDGDASTADSESAQRFMAADIECVAPYRDAYDNEYEILYQIPARPGS